MKQFSRQMRLGRRNFFPTKHLLVLLALFCIPAVAWGFDGAENGQNSLQSIRIKSDASLPIVEINTAMPVGYRYTVYDSYDPVRIIVDLPGMDVSAVQSPIKANAGPLQEIRTGSFDLASGRLGRIELLLTREAKYKVFSEENLFSVIFVDAAAENPISTVDSKPVAVSAVSVPDVAGDVASAAASPPLKTAGLVKSVQIKKGKVVLEADGTVENYQFFHLRAPPRLVVDVYGVKAGFPDRKYPVTDGFQQLRVGTSYEDKVRFVLDAGGKEFPEHKVFRAENRIVISWGGDKSDEQLKAVTGTDVASNAGIEQPKAPLSLPAVDRKKGSGEKTVDYAPSVVGLQKKISVEGVEFTVEGEKSLLTITLSAPAEVSEPVKEGEVLRFSIKNARIDRSLRRVIDASAFPSAVKLITPYSVDGGDEVRFTTELKGDVPFFLRQENGKILLVVNNERFAEPKPPAETVTIPLPAAPVSAPVQAVAAKEAVLTPAPAVFSKAESLEAKPILEPEIDRSGKHDAGSFTGERISLVFDDANIRNILQLIGEVSNLNIIAAEDVKGTITLRLIDVPWDQALNLILETKGLGMLREGNVVRILAKDQIRAMRQAELTAVKEERQLESVVTEVIPISYTALNNIATPAKELLTDRGKITEDARNKQIIITDIPSVIESVKKLAVILDTPERQVMIEARIVEAGSTFGRDLGVKWGLSYKPTSSGYGDISNANVGLGGSFLIAPPAAGSVMGGAGLGSGITFGRVGIDSTVLDLRISALESAGYGKVISTPRVSTLNGGTASISQGTKIPYQSSGTDGLPKTEFVDANLELTVQPVINPDDSIILDISATNSSIGSTVSTGGGTAPAIDTKEAKTKVLVRNGETTVIGGIFVESENASQAGVPWLMKVPILGHLFRSDNKSSSRSELLVFITPRIVQ